MSMPDSSGLLGVLEHDLGAPAAEEAAERLAEVLAHRLERLREPRRRERVELRDRHLELRLGVEEVLLLRLEERDLLLGLLELRRSRSG